MGKFYSTDDLIKMGQLGNFGNYSPVVTRALIKLKQLEEENKNLQTVIESYQNIDDIQQEYNSEFPKVEDLESSY